MPIGKRCSHGQAKSGNAAAFYPRKCRQSRICPIHVVKHEAQKRSTVPQRLFAELRLRSLRLPAPKTRHLRAKHHVSKACKPKAHRRLQQARPSVRHFCHADFVSISMSMPIKNSRSVSTILRWTQYSGRQRVLVTFNDTVTTVNARPRPMTVLYPFARTLRLATSQIPEFSPAQFHGAAQSLPKSVYWYTSIKGNRNATRAAHAKMD